MTIETEISPAMPETTGAMPPVWKRLRFEAAASAAEEPTLASLLNAAILSHDHLRDALDPIRQSLSTTFSNPVQVQTYLKYKNFKKKLHTKEFISRFPISGPQYQLD